MGLLGLLMFQHSAIDIDTFYDYTLAKLILETPGLIKRFEDLIMIPLLDKTKLIVTGAAGRIGYAVSKEALSLVASVLMVDITNERLQILAKELEQNFPGKVYTYNCDITKTDEITAMLEFAILSMGCVTSAVHGAYPVTQNWGIKFEDLTSEIVNEHLSSQLGSCIMLSQVILNHFKQQGGGNLIHISSIQGISAPKFTHYEGTDMTSPLEYSL